MDLVSGAVGSVITKLGELLLTEYKLQKGLPEIIEFLIQELESAHTALDKVREVPLEQLDPQVRLWAREVREASYDMEDILDTFLVSSAAEVMATPADNKDGLLRRLQKKMAKLINKSKARHTIAGAIEDMKKRLKDVADRRDRFSVAVALPAPATTPDPRLAAMHIEAAQIIGVDKARAELIAMLLPSSSHGHGDEDVPAGGISNKMKIISVVGCGGLGKTTLAKAVYDKLRPQYDYGAFVSVGRKPDLMQVFKDIFFHLCQNKFDAIRKVRSLQLLLGELQSFLENKRYFIVIDDVWDITTWKAIKLALDQRNSGSIVITTTRNREVSSSEEVYQLDPLSRDNSRKLFYTRLFGGEDRCPANHPTEASEKILHKCSGVPLAIITMASLLVGKPREDWFDVCNSPGFYGRKDSQQVDDTVWILSLSYYDLPSVLKTCLLYLTVYPEDYAVDKTCLIWKWIAEGFVEKKKGSGLFEQGELYFNHLINRSMIQAVGSEVDGTLEYRVHDMVLDLIRDLSDRENFVAISDNVESTSPPKKKRRLAYQSRMMEQSKHDNHVDIAQVRTLVACSCDIFSWVLHPRFKLLRVLALENCITYPKAGTEAEDCTVPWYGLKHLGSLVHLRYLGLRGTFIDELPEEIGALKLLQTLDMPFINVHELPSSISLLTQLVCLSAEHSTVPDGFFKKVTSLEELQIELPDYGVDVQRRRQCLNDLGNLSELRVLYLYDCGGKLDQSMQAALVQTLGNLHELLHLELYANDSVKDAAREWDTAVLSRHLRFLVIGNILFPRLPSFIDIAHFPSLRHLQLHVDSVDEAGLRILGGLPELCCLNLSFNNWCPWKASITVVANINGLFHKLTYCAFGGLVRLVLNEDATGVFFSIWSGKGEMPTFGSRTKDDKCSRSEALGLMPNLRELHFTVPAGALYKDGRNGSCDNLGLQYLPSIQRVRAYINCKGAFIHDVSKAEEELRHVAEVHPNRPTLTVNISRKHKMMPRSTDKDNQEVHSSANVLVPLGVRTP